MKSQTSKVLHRIAGRSLLHHVTAAVTPLVGEELRVVVGAHREQVEHHLADIAPDAISIFQAERNGTGHAVQLALAGAQTSGSVLVVAGDTPLLTTATLKEFIDAHTATGSAASVLTAIVPDATGYGRIVRDAADQISRIEEERAASEDEKLIDEINTGVYLFDNHVLREMAAKLSNENSQGELYLTDVMALTRSAGKVVLAYPSQDYTETLGINDRAQLSECAALMRNRINEHLMKSGVSIIDPTTTWIDCDAVVAADATIHQGSTISGKSIVEAGATIGPRTTLVDCIVRAGASVIESTCTSSEIGAAATVGPYTYLRPGTVLGTGAKAGAFVEMKSATLGDGSKVPHLSYVGDATIGTGTNVGAATIFVNYDGVAKHHSTIGDHVRIGSDSMIVAPVTIGDGAYTAAGSVITDDVPAGSMAVARAKQRNVLGWVLRKRAGSKSAEAALQAGNDQAEKDKGE